MPPCTCSTAVGQTADEGSGLPVGNVVALNPFVCRQYDSLWKIRYVRM